MGEQDRQRTSSDLVEQVKQLEEQMVSRDAVVRKLTHDIKTPLTSILLELDMLDRRWEKQEKGKFEQSRERLMQHCEELMELIQELDDAL